MKRKKTLTTIIAIILLFAVVATPALAYSTWPKHSWRTYMPTRRAGTGSTPAYNDVKAIQSILTWQGYGNLAIDGKFGTAIRTAVIAFQEAHNLGNDGVVGPNTWEVLQDQLVQRPNMPDARGYCDYSVDNTGSTARRLYHIYTGAWWLISPSVCILS